MPLQSHLLACNERLQKCLFSDPAHVVPGDRGEHVWRIQVALIAIDGATIAKPEFDARTYGPTTTAAVLAYKTARSIINTSYQSKADNIVGKMTIASLDAEMLKIQAASPRPRPARKGPAKAKGIKEVQAEIVVRTRLITPSDLIAGIRKAVGVPAGRPRFG